MTTSHRISLLICTSLALSATSCGRARATNESKTEVRAVRVQTIPSDPSDASWEEVPVHRAPLVPQDMVEPRKLDEGSSEVQVQAVHDGTQVAFRLSWVDATDDNLPGSARFADACAVQLPSEITADIPAPQMGEDGRAVEIIYWSAFWQATVDGRADNIKAIYPGASVDHYPFEAAPLTPGSREQEAMAKRYAPARALGNQMAGPRDRPVQDLVAEGPGTLRPAPRTVSNGTGKRTETGWSVELTRPLPQGLGAGERSQVAFAVWDGAHEDVGARKMRSLWIPIGLEGTQ